MVSALSQRWGNRLTPSSKAARWRHPLALARQRSGGADRSTGVEVEGIGEGCGCEVTVTHSRLSGRVSAQPLSKEMFMVTKITLAMH